MTYESSKTKKEQKEKEEKRVRAASRRSEEVQVDEPVETAVSGTYDTPIFMGQKERERKLLFFAPFFFLKMFYSLHDGFSSSSQHHHHQRPRDCLAR